jgi:spermidine synthase
VDPLLDRDLRLPVHLFGGGIHGTVRVKETKAKNQEDRYRSLVHGNILHGMQFLDPPYDRVATTYYKTSSGVGLAIELKKKAFPRPIRVGVVGLGAGTLAAYGNEEDVFRFYEINPQVIDIALREFTYLKDTAATVEISLGDARLNLERETEQQFDVLAIDAFSSDSIPVHLITLEALAVYERHMQPDGIIAFHVSNRFLDLKPVIQQLADARGLHAVWINETRDDESTISDWILLSRDEQVLLKPTLVMASKPIAPKPGLRMWTDDFNNIVQVLE